MAEREGESINTQQKIENIFRQSYFISQGWPKLQGLLFEWLAVENIVSLKEYKSITFEWLEKFTSPKIHDEAGHLGKKTQKTDPWVQMDGFHSALTHEIIDPNPSPAQLAYDIFTKLVEIDILYQVLDRPERTQLKKITPDSTQDSHKSYVRHYIINNNYDPEPFCELFEVYKRLGPQNLLNTKVDVSKIQSYDALSWNRDELRKTIEVWTSVLHIDTKIAVLIKFWEQNHPGYKFFEI